ncbi:MAG TPA: hypothetical protein VN731_10255 [Rhodanobacter sp.]|nr:hypothetical protein [Rhodanobacter sp.]
MNTRPTEPHTYYDLRVQLELERLLAAKRADEAAREERYRRLRTPSMVEPDPETVPTWERGDDSLPPVKFWLAWIGMLAFSLGCTYGAIKFIAWLPKLWEIVA